MNKNKANKSLYDCQYASILKVVDNFFKDEAKSKLWMKTKNPLLGNVSPITMLKLGRFDKLMDFVYTQLEENTRETEN